MLTTTEAPLVPPARLAALLIERRVERGLDIADLSAASVGAFSPAYLDAVERGLLPLDENMLGKIIDLYQVAAEPIVPSRSKLLLDLDRQELHVGDQSISFESPAADAVLERYVSLLYLLRDTTPGRRLTLRDEDLDILGDSLGRDQPRLRRELLAIMADNKTVDRTASLRRRKTIVGAGLLVGATALGSLVLVTQTFRSTAKADLIAPVEITETVTGVETQISDSPRLITLTSGASAASFDASAERTGLQAEAMVDYKFRQVLVGWQINYAVGSDQWRGVTNSVEKTITVHVDAGATPESTAEVLMHEVGHAIDLEFMTEETRAEWVEMRGMPSTWWTGDGLSDFAVGAGDFAEAVAALTTGSESRSVYGDFTEEQLAFVAQVVG